MLILILRYICSLLLLISFTTSHPIILYFLKIFFACITLENQRKPIYQYTIQLQTNTLPLPLVILGSIRNKKKKTFAVTFYRWSKLIMSTIKLSFYTWRLALAKQATDKKLLLHFTTTKLHNITKPSQQIQRFGENFQGKIDRMIWWGFFVV